MDQDNRRPDSRNRNTLHMTDSGMTSTEDAQWVRDVLDEYERPLLHYCLKIVRCTETAQDVVQDAFLRLVEGDRSTIEDHTAEWLFTVCRNRCLDIIRKDRRVNTMTEGQERALTSREHATASEPSRTDDRTELIALLDGLPDRQEEVIRLKFLGGLSYREISRVTELTVSNVGFLIHTGLKTIRGQMNSDADRASSPNLGLAR